MDLAKCGAFLAARRKALGLTQQELAEKIGVSDKAVSKWETGRGFPDVSLLRPLSEALGVTIAELVNGEAAEEDAAARADDAVLAAFEWSRRMRGQVIGALLIFWGGFLFAIPSFWAGPSALGIACAPLGVALIALGGALRRGALSRLRLSVKGATVGTFAALTAALALEASPWGVVMVFAPGPETRVRETYSFFSLTPVGYGNAFPFLAGCGTIASALLLLAATLRHGRGRKLRDAAYVITWFAAALTAATLLLFGQNGLSAAGMGVIVLLALSAWFQAQRGGAGA